MKKRSKAAAYQAAMEEAAKVALQAANELGSIPAPPKDDRKKSNGTANKKKTSGNSTSAKKGAGVKANATKKAADPVSEEVAS